MEIGQSGANGAHAVRHVKKGNNREHVNVMRLLPNMAERNAKGTLIKLKFATATFHAQVTLFIYKLREI